MDIILLLVILLIFSGLRISEKNQFFEDYCSIRQTNAIKGIFTIIIMICHAEGYFPFAEADLHTARLSVYLKQLIVVPILFYSGFGIMESIKNKGLPYIKSIPRRHVLKTFIIADISVLLYVVSYWTRGITLSLKRILLALVFWDSVENNTWYFFVIILLYLITYICFRVFHKNNYIALIATIVLSLPLFAFLIRTREIFWYNTFFLYHFGMLYSVLRKYIERLVMQNDLAYGIAMSVAFMLYVVFRTFGSFYYFIICGCFMMTVIVGLTMKVRIDNAFFQFLGSHVFGFYVFQRLPMFYVSTLPTNTALKFIISVLITAVMSLIFDKLVKLTENRIKALKNKK